MYVLIDHTGAASLVEPHAFTAFKLVTELPKSCLGAALGKVGTLKDTDHVWVSQAWLREQGAAYGDDWAKKLDGMISYAASKGWLDENAGAILAHIE
jgi:hypothetical protein